MLSRVISESDCVCSPTAWRNRDVPEAAPEEEAVQAAERDPPPDRMILAAEIEQKVREAYESGRRDADIESRSRAESQVREAIERLAATIVEIAGTRNEAIRRAEADTVRLSLEVARRVLHRELTIDPSALDALVRAALEKLRSQESYRVRVHPDLEHPVRKCIQKAGRDPAIEVISDATLARGAAVFETSRGSLDASVDTQLSEIERGLADYLGERS